MKLIPSAKLDMTTSLSIEELEEYLRENIQQNRNYRIGSINKLNKYFVGTVFPDHFKCKKFTYQQNSFLPQVTGIFLEAPQGTKVKINLKVDSFVTIFLYLFIAVIFCVFLVTLFMVTTQDSALYIALIPLAILIIFMALPHIGFHLEKEHTISELKKILSAYPHGQ
ncbi:hypothetical protein [Maribacter forsetii]|uniref:hypothetical protein n=1 Tax=Maribacter forsetii TaxID=444515 RepID=UPI0005667B56|nr:hypothetical protein [Maribacter forsetii]